MRRRRPRTLMYALGCSGVFLTSAAMPARGQESRRPPAARQDDTLQSLLEEVRQLRVTLERGSLFSARTQLLVGRLALQDERVREVRSEVVQVRDQIAFLGTELLDSQRNSAEAERTLGEETDPRRRPMLEQQLNEGRAQASRLAAKQQELRPREAELSQSLETEVERLNELQRRLDQVEKDIERTIRESGLTKRD